MATPKTSETDSSPNFPSASALAQPSNSEDALKPPFQPLAGSDASFASPEASKADSSPNPLADDHAPSSEPEYPLSTSSQTSDVAPAESSDNHHDASTLLGTTAIQPAAKPEPDLVPRAAPPPAVGKRRSHRSRRFKAVMRGLGSFFVSALSLLWIGLLYGIPGIVIAALGIVVFIGIPFAFTSAYGAVAILIGNGILRAAHMAHYTNNASAAAIGATGAIIASMALGVAMQCLCLKYDEEHPAPWYVQMIGTVVVHTLSGAIGCAILLRHHVDLGGIDVLHATRAGALGGAVMGPGSIIALPVILAALGIIFSPLWIAMMMGLRWCYVRSSESYEGSVYRYSHCVTYGTCGDDEDIEEELRHIPRYDHRGRQLLEF